MRKGLLITVCATAMMMANGAKAATSGSCGATDADCHWELIDGVLTISGNGAMNNYTWEEKFRYDGVDKWGEDTYTYLGDYSSAPWGDLKNSITSVVIGDDVTSVGNSAFFGLNALESVTIGDSVTSIGHDAFHGTNISQVAIPESVTSIGEYAFQGLSGLSSVDLPENLTSIGHGAFANTSLTSIEIPKNVKDVGDGAFSYVPTLQSIAILGSQTNIHGDIFEYTRHGDFLNLPLTDITIPDNFSFITTSNFTVTDLDELEMLYDDNNITYEEYEQLRSQAEAALAENDEFSFTISRPKYNSLDLSGVNIHCIGNTDQCAANMAAAGYEEGTYTLTQVTPKSTSTRIELADGSTKVIDADGKVHFEGKRIFTTDEANEVAGKTNTFSIRYR